MKLKCLLCFIILILQLFSYQSAGIDSVKDYKNMPGIQVYHFRSRSYFMYSSWEKVDETTIKGQLSLYIGNMFDIPAEGMWVSAGLGSPGMDSSDMVMCMFYPNAKVTHKCVDYWSEGHHPQPDTQLGGTNDVELTSSHSDLNLNTNEWGNYNKAIVWNFTKKITNDIYDWKNLDSIMTNKGYIIGAYGDTYTNGDIKFHSDYTSNKLIDGDGLPKKDKKSDL